MDAFDRIFKKVDRGNKGKITVRDLEVYAEDNNIDANFVDKWKNLFDPEGSGSIDYKHFCSTLGLAYKAPPKEIKELLGSNMTEPMKSKAFELLQEKQDLSDDMDLFRSAMLEGMQKDFGGDWDCTEHNHLNDAKHCPHMHGSLLCFCMDEDKNDVHALYKKNPKYGKMVSLKSDFDEDEDRKLIGILDKSLNKYPDVDSDFIKDALENINDDMPGDWYAKTSPNAGNSISDRHISLLAHGDEAHPITIAQDDSSIVKSQPADRDAVMVYECNMTEYMKQYALKSVYDNYRDDGKEPEMFANVTRDMNRQYGTEWRCRSIDSEKNLPIISHENGTLLACSPDGQGRTKMLLYREANTGKRKKACCKYCCC